MKSIFKKNRILIIGSVLLSILSSILFLMELVVNQSMINEVKSQTRLSIKMLIFVLGIFVISYGVYYIKLRVMALTDTNNRKILNSMIVDELLSDNITEFNSKFWPDKMKQFISLKIPYLSNYFFNEIYNFIYEIVFVICGTIFLAIYNFRVMVMSFIIYIIAWVISYSIGKYSDFINKKLSDNLYTLTSQINSKKIMSDQIILQSTLNHHLKDLDKSINNYAYITFKRNILQNLNPIIQESLSIIRDLLVLFFSVFLVSENFGELVLILLISTNLSIPFQSIGIHIQSIKSCQSIIKEVNQLKNSISSEMIESEISKIEVKKLNKKFNNRDILFDFNYVFNSGFKYLIKGSSGSGKTTLVKMLLNIDIPDSGNIEVIDKNGKYLDSYYQNIIYISQNSTLFELSILENITLTTEDEVNWEKYNEIKRIIELEINDSMIFDSASVRFSGGEIQKILLARALYHDKKCIILDEAFSSLDNKISMKLEDVFLKLQNIMLINIAHYTYNSDEIGYDEIIDLDKL